MSEVKIWNETIALPYAYTLGPVNSRFFQGLINKKIYATKCPDCGRVLVPARKFCSRCFKELDEWVGVSTTGTIKSWTLINFAYQGQPVKPPYISALIQLDGTDTAIAHFIGGVDLSNLDQAVKKVKIGMKVEAVWNEERDGRIFDIKHFIPIEG